MLPQVLQEQNTYDVTYIQSGGFQIAEGNICGNIRSIGCTELSTSDDTHDVKNMLSIKQITDVVRSKFNMNSLSRNWSSTLIYM